MEKVYVVQLDLSLAEKLKSDLIEKGFSLSIPPYTLFQGKSKDLSCTLYASGKLVVQGKKMQEFVELYLEPEILKTFTLGYEHLQIDLSAHLGVDESGKGDFFGPLCIAGVFAQGAAIENLVKMKVKDSKRLSESTILKLASEIKKNYVHHLVTIFPTKYNELYTHFGNLNSLLAWGHATVIENLSKKSGCQNALIDQFASEHLVENALKRKGLNIILKQKTHGESDPVVAAASILARAAFVNGMKRLEEEVGEKLPKGASNSVIETGKKLVRRLGKSILNSVAKIHFNTYAQITNNLHEP